MVYGPLSIKIMGRITKSIIVANCCYDQRLKIMTCFVFNIRKLNIVKHFPARPVLKYGFKQDISWWIPGLSFQLINSIYKFINSFCNWKMFITFTVI